MQGHPSIKPSNIQTMAWVPRPDPHTESLTPVKSMNVAGVTKSHPSPFEESLRQMLAGITQTRTPSKQMSTSNALLAKALRMTSSMDSLPGRPDAKPKYARIALVSFSTRCRPIFSNRWGGVAFATTDRHTTKFCDGTRVRPDALHSKTWASSSATVPRESG